MRTPYQFTIRRLLFLSAAVAVCMGLARCFDVPPIMQSIIGVYASLFVIAVVMRWPALRAKQREFRKRRQEFLEHRRILAAEVQQKRADSRDQPKSSDS